MEVEYQQGSRLLTPEDCADKAAWREILKDSTPPVLARWSDFEDPDHRADRKQKPMQPALCDLFIGRPISQRRKAVQLTPKGHTDRVGRLNDLGNSFHCRFGRTGDLKDIEKAIRYQEQAVKLTPNGHDDKPRLLSDLGNSLESQSVCTGELIDIQEAIRCKQQAVLLTPNGHNDKPGRLNNLGISFYSRFRWTGELKDIDEAIRCQQEAVNLIPDGHADKPGMLNNLGISLETRSERTGELKDVESAIRYQLQAVLLTPDGHADKPGRLNNLGNSLETRSRRTGEVKDVEDAIRYQHQAVLLTPDVQTDKPGRLNNLGIFFYSRFRWTGELKDIDEAIRYQQEAVLLIPDGHAAKPGMLNNLGISLEIRSERTGELKDVEDAIRYQHQAVLLAPNGHADKPGRLNNLGISFRNRFRRTGELKDIDEAIRYQQQAVLLTPDDHADKPGMLNNFANSLEIRCGQTGELRDIDDAIRYQQQAVLLTPDGHADKPVILNDLGICFQTRYGQTSERTDVEDALKNLQQAIRLTPDDHADRSGRLNDLGRAFQSRFEWTKKETDIEEAIEYLHQAVLLTPPGHPDLFGRRHDLDIAREWSVGILSYNKSDPVVASADTRSPASDWTGSSVRHGLLSAKNALQHAIKIESDIVHALLSHGTTCDFSIEVGFDEVVLERGIGYLELICVRLSSIAPDNISDLSIRLGQLLSPFPGVIFTTSTSHLAVLSGGDGEVWDVDDIVERRVISQFDAFSKLLMLEDDSHEQPDPEVDQGEGSSSRGNNEHPPEKEAEGSGHQSDGGDQGSRREKGKGRDLNDRENSKDQNDGAGGYKVNDDQGQANNAVAPSISFEAAACIYRGRKEEVGAKGSLFQTLITSGTVTNVKDAGIIALASSSSSGALPQPKSKVEFDDLRFQSTACSLSARYRQVAARVEIDSMHERTITKASPPSTPASDGKVKHVSAQKFSLLATVIFGANYITAPLSGSIGSTAEASTSSETTRFGSKIDQNQSRGKSTWEFDVDDQHQQLGGLRILEKLNLPRASFTYFEGSPQSTMIQVASTWKLDKTRGTRGILLANLSHSIELKIPSDLPSGTQIFCQTTLEKSSNSLAETEAFMSDNRIEQTSWVRDPDSPLPTSAHTNLRGSSSRITCAPVEIVVPDPSRELPQASGSSSGDATSAETSIPVPSENNPVEPHLVITPKRESIGIPVLQHQRM